LPTPAITIKGALERVEYIRLLKFTSHRNTVPHLSLGMQILTVKLQCSSLAYLRREITTS